VPRAISREGSGVTEEATVSEAELNGAETGAEEDETDATQRYERSRIRFPYTDLIGAERLANAIYHEYGGNCTMDQLAAAVKSTTTSSSFKVRVASAGTFGVVKVRKQRVELTELGRRLVDPHTRSGARVEAFLRVPLYKAIFDNHRGGIMPLDSGLESEIVELGVTPSQKERARQVFQRSAEYAGFFDHGRDRLVMPAPLEADGSSSPEPIPGEAEPAPAAAQEDPDAGFLSRLHPIIAGLVRMLPGEKDTWPVDKQKAWLKVAQVNFEFLYGSEEQSSSNDRIHQDSQM
jgi:hypothetical protein